MSESFITLGTFFLLGIIFHYFQKICERDYKANEEKFKVFLEENKQYAEWEYNLKKHQLNKDYIRKWIAFVFKCLCFILSILIFIDLIIK